MRCFLRYPPSCSGGILFDCRLPQSTAHKRSCSARSRSEEHAPLCNQWRPCGVTVMQTRQSATAVLFLALSLTTAVVQDMTTSSVGTGMNTTQALAGRQLAAWDAPVGHHQPTIVDLPP